MIPLPPNYDPKEDFIELISHNSAWKKLAKTEIQKIQTLLPFKWLKNIQHIGSTALPSIQAKPIIDIYVGIESLRYANQAIEL